MNLKYLNKEERAAIQKVRKALRDRHPGLVRNVYLFGSKARGDFTQDSDLDLLIVTERLNPKLRREIVFFVSDIGFEYGLYISPKVMDSSHFRHLLENQTPFGMNVIKEGMSLWPTP